MQPEHNRRRFYHNPKILIPALALAVLLTATAGTMAWLRYVRSLQTVTLIHVSDLYLEGPKGENSTAINLGSIGPEPNYYYAFGVKSNVQQYQLQLAYTTNLRLNYSIYRASKTSTESLTNSTIIDGIDFFYDQNQPVNGKYLNSENGQVANKERHDITYKKSDGSSNVYSPVQVNAEPVYWQSEYLNAAVGSVDYYVLKVSWIGEMQSNKETDMIYLTAGSGSTGGSQ